MVGVAFGVGLLASGLASTAVGAYAGSEIMAGLLRIRVPVLARRVVTLIPALLVLAVGIDPDPRPGAEPGRALARHTASHWSRWSGSPAARSVMGEFVNGRALRLASVAVTVGIVLLNVVLLVLAVKG